MKTYVISLSTAIKRREHIKQEFGKQNIAFSFFDAILPNQITELSGAMHIDIADSCEMSSEEKACFMSHVYLWQKMLDDNHDYIAIFEDDVFLGENAYLFFHKNSWLTQNNIGLVKLGTFLQKVKLSANPIAVLDNRYLHQLKERHMGAEGYIIHRSVAEKLIKLIQSLPAEKQLPIDIIVFEIFLKSNPNVLVYQLQPALCIQEFIHTPDNINMPSYLEKNRVIQRQYKTKRTFIQKIKAESCNALRKTVGKLVRTKVGFR